MTTTKQVQFEITDPALDIPPMAFPTNEVRAHTLDYLLNEYGVTLADVAQIVFTRVDTDGTMHIEGAYQHGVDVTRFARFV